MGSDAPRRILAFGDATWSSYVDLSSSIFSANVLFIYATVDDDGYNDDVDVIISLIPTILETLSLAINDAKIVIIDLINENILLLV